MPYRDEFQNWLLSAVVDDKGVLMRSRDLVLKAIEFRSPERIPLAKGESADVTYVSYAPARDFVPAKEGMNEWGCVWKSLNPNAGDQGQVIEHPLADWNRFRDFRFPDPFAPGRMDHLPARLRQCHRDGKFVCAMIGKGPMHLLDDLRGFENYLTDLLLSPENIELLLDGIFGFLSGMVRQFAEAKVDAVLLVDDQAMQTGPLFSMEIWRERFKPGYRKLFTLAHECGLKACLHACGDISQHLPDLVEAGVDVIDNKQPALWMNYPAVDAVRGKVTFSTCLDIQTTMHEIAEDQIEEELARLIRRLSVPDGGFIGTYYDQPNLQIPLEKTQRMLEAFRNFRWRDVEKKKVASVANGHERRPVK